MRNILRGIRTILAVALVAASGLYPEGAVAQDKPTLAADDYDRWESLGPASLAPDGLWLAVAVRRVDETSELRIHRTDSDSVVIVAEGSRPEFSADGNWLAYTIGVSPDERERLGERGDPVRNGVGLLNLGTGEREEIEAMQSFSFSDDGRYLALRRYGPEESESDGADVLVRNLTRGESMSFGNVSEFAWQEEVSLLAMTVDAEDRVGNGVRLYDPASGRIRSLDSDEATYRELTWREDAPDLAVLKTFEDEAHEDTAHVALAWRDPGFRQSPGVRARPASTLGTPRGHPDRRAPRPFLVRRWAPRSSSASRSEFRPRRRPQVRTPEGTPKGTPTRRTASIARKTRRAPASRSGIRSMSIRSPSSACARRGCGRSTISAAWDLADGGFLLLGGRSRGPGRDRRWRAPRAGARRDALRRRRDVPPAVPRPLRRRRAHRAPGTRPGAGDDRHGLEPRRTLCGLVRGRGLLDARPRDRRDPERDRKTRRDVSWTSTGRRPASRWLPSALPAGWKMTRRCS